jgi:hypothetical protein
VVGAFLARDFILGGTPYIAGAISRKIFLVWVRTGMYSSIGTISLPTVSTLGLASNTDMVLPKLLACVRLRTI